MEGYENGYKKKSDGCGLDWSGCEQGKVENTFKNLWVHKM
jgi:hypothetical protein